jgi:hypothetical protein
MAQAMVLAQEAQLAGLRAAERYIDTGDALNLSGQGGVLEQRTAAASAVRAFQQQKLNFMRDNDMIKKEDKPDA